MINILEKINSILAFAFISIFLFYDKSGYLILMSLVILLPLTILGKFALKLDKYEITFFCVYIFFFLLPTIHTLSFGAEIREIDTISRFILVLPLYFIFRGSNFSTATLLNGMKLAIILGIFSLYSRGEYLAFAQNEGFVSLTYTIFALIFLLTISNRGVFYKNLNNVFFFILSSGLALYSGGRGAWIAGIFTLLIFVFINPMKWNKNYTKMVIISFVLGVNLVYFSNFLGVQDRVFKGINYLNAWVTEERKHGQNIISEDSSVGIRLELLKASYAILRDNYVLGIGEGNFKEYNQKLIQENLISNSTAEFNHPHNEIVNTLVEQGLLGLFALFLVLVFPIVYLIKRDSFQEDQEKIIAMIILNVINFNYLFYALTNAIFAHQIYALFYSFMCVVLVSILNKKYN